MHVGDTARNTTTVTVASVRKPHITHDRTRPLADSAASLLDRMEHLQTIDSVGAVAAALECSAMCQWVVELTYRIVKCSYVGIAQVRDEALTIEPVAEVGSPTGDRRAWWVQVANVLLTDRAARAADAPLVEAPLVVQLPSPPSASGRHSQARRSACVVPLRIGGELAAVFGLEAQGSAPTPPLDIQLLARAMASIAAMTLEAKSHRPARGAHDTAALRAELDQMDGVLGWVSHELNSPLTTIMGCLQLVGPKVEHLALQAPRSAGTQKALASIQERLALASRYAEIEARLASDLVDASRVRSAQMTLRPQPCDLGQIVREAVESQRVTSSRRVIHLEVPVRDVPISADPDRIEQVVANFLGNALKYSPKDKHVEVCVELLKTSARVSVRDFGPGLEKPDLTRVWQRFYRVRGVPVHSATGSGLGLGLYIARDIVRRHGGKVGVTSAPGHGATFWFELPLVASA